MNETPYEYPSMFTEDEFDPETCEVGGLTREEAFVVLSGLRLESGPTAFHDPRDAAQAARELPTTPPFDNRVRKLHVQYPHELHDDSDNE